MFCSSPGVGRIAIGLTAGAAAVSAVVGFALPTQAAAPTQDKHHFQWTAVEKESTKPQPIRAGDTWTAYLELHKGKGGKPGETIGDVGARCGAVTVTAQGPTVQCLRVLRTKGGSLTLSSMLDRFGPGPYSTDVAVLGGTGAYRGARGEARMSIDGKIQTFDIHLDD